MVGWEEARSGGRKNFEVMLDPIERGRSGERGRGEGVEKGVEGREWRKE